MTAPSHPFVHFCLLVPALAWIPDSARAAEVSFQLIDVESGKPTPAMVCITGKENREVALPPTGEVVKEASSTKVFYQGVRFSDERNWVGPVRRMQGKGSNDDRSYVYEMRPSLPYWDEPVMYQTSGDFTIDLKPGQWRIAVEHGNEYVPVVEEFTVRPDDAPRTRRIELERWADMPGHGWWSGDVHVHHPIQEPAHQEFLIHYAKAADLHVVNVLEMGHHEGTDFKQQGFGRASRVIRDNFALVAGQEEPRSEFGHIIGLNLTGLVRDLSTYDYYDVAFRNIHKQPGALVGFAHFSWNGCALPRGFPWYITTGELDFIELMQFGMINGADYYDYLNLGFRLSAAAGSDIPWGSTLGEVRTYVHTGRPFDVDKWFDGLKTGRTFVTNGPVLDFTVDGQLAGSDLKRSPGDKVKVFARASSHQKIGVLKWLRVIGPDGVIEEAVNDDRLNELEIELNVPLRHSGWMVASAMCENNAQAHTSPVYLTVDRRETFNPERGPAVIQKQLEGIAVIEKEVAGKADDRSRGILERLNKAKDFYAQLRTEMQSAGAGR